MATRSSARRAVSLVALVLGLGFAAWTLATDDGVAALRQLDLQTLVLLVPVMIVGLVVQSLQVHLLVEKAAERPISRWAWFRLFVVGRFLNTVVPQAGNVYRALQLKREFGVRYTRYVSAYFSLMWLTTTLYTALAVLVIGVLEPELKLVGVPAILPVAVLTALLALGPGLALLVTSRMRVSSPLVARLHGIAHEVLTVSVRSLTDVGYALRLLAASVATWMLSLLGMWLVMRALAPGSGLGSAALFHTVSRLSNIVVISPANLGVQEAGFGLMGGGLGVGLAQGVLVSVVHRAASTVVLFAMALPLGGWAALREGVPQQDPTTPEE